MHLPKRDIFITVRLEWKHKSLSIMQSKINKGCSLGSINRRYTEHILRLTLHQTAISLPLIQKQHYRYVCTASDFKQQLKTSFIISGLNIMRRGLDQISIAETETWFARFCYGGPSIMYLSCVAYENQICLALNWTRWIGSLSLVYIIKSWSTFMRVH